jgi:hypothetical protein
MASISRRTQLYLNKVMYAALFGLVAGALVWLSVFKLIELPDDEGRAIILIKAVKLNEEVVFHYPDVGGALRLSPVKQNENGAFQVQVGEDFVALDENLVVGVVKFRF